VGLDNKTVITGWAFDSNNNPLPNGTSVTFAILSGPGARINWGMIQPSSSVGDSGKFTVDYFSGLLPGNVVIQATISASSGPITATITITLVDRSPSLLQINVSPSSLDADGRSSAGVTVFVFDASGQAVPDGTVVNLSILPSSTGSGSLGSTSLTTSKGVVTTTFTAGLQGGTVYLSAQAGSVSVTTPVYLVDRSPRRISLSINPMTIEQNGQATITATVYDGNNRPVLAGTPVSFFVSGVAGAVINPPNVSTDDQGRATSTLFAGLGTGVAQISVTAPGNVTAQGVVSIIQPAIGSIQFVGAIPQTIGVKGSSQMGNSSLPEVSTLRFQVLTSSNRPVPDGTPVTFALEAPLGTTIMVTSATTVDGIVETRIRSGTVSGVARVIAFTTFGGNVFIAPSNGVVIQAGPPMDGHVSIAVKPEDFLVAGRTYDGITQQFTIYLGDRYDNPIPDGTPIYFSSEAGIIDPQSLSANGSASFVLRTANPRPFAVTSFSLTPNLYLDYTYPPGCAAPPCHSFTAPFTPDNALVTVIALVRGEERYWDLNGNGVYDPGEPFVDLSEPYLDLNNNGQYDAVLTDYSGTFTQVSEPFWDAITQDGQFNPGNGRYDPSAILFFQKVVVWSADVYILQYQPRWFYDTNGNSRFDPDQDLILTSKSASPSTFTSEIPVVCGVSGGAVVGVPQNPNRVKIWIGDDNGVVPRDDQKLSLSVLGGVGLTVDPSTQDWGLPASLTGFTFEISLKNTASQADQFGIGTVSILIPTGAGTNIRLGFPVCVLP
jgi:hypothetical protein